MVVFSPTGCEGMLRALGRLRVDAEGEGEGEGEVGKEEVGEGVGKQGGCKEGEEGEGVRKEEEKEERKQVFIATIGPTTRDYLLEKFGVEADVCAEVPSPEGVEVGIRRFMRERGL